MWAQTLPTSHLRQSRTGDYPPSTPAHPGTGAVILAKAFLTAFIQASSGRRDIGGDRCVHQHRIFTSLTYKRTGLLGILLLSSLQNLSGSQSIITGTGLSNFIIQWKCHLLIWLKLETVWPPHNNKLEVPSFPQKAWNVLWLTAVLMSWGFRACKPLPLLKPLPTPPPYPGVLDSIPSPSGDFTLTPQWKLLCHPPSLKRCLSSAKFIWGNERKGSIFALFSSSLWLLAKGERFPTSSTVEYN